MQNLQDEPADPRPDWEAILPRAVFLEIVRVLRGALPPPMTDDPAIWVQRDQAAMAGVAALLPITAAEGRLAAQYVTADAWAMECLRLAGKCEFAEPEAARRCRAQAMGLLREAKSSMRLLLRLQEQRQTREENAQAAERAAWSEHVALRIMGEGLCSPARVPDEREVTAPASAPAAPTGVDRDTAPRVVRKFRSKPNRGKLFRDTRRETKLRQAEPGGTASGPRVPELIAPGTDIPGTDIRGTDIRGTDIPGSGAA